MTVTISDVKSYGVAPNNWFHSEETGFDLSRGCSTKTRSITSQKGQLVYDPTRSALVIIDLQNFFIHPAVRPHPFALAAADRVAEILPLARAAGIRIIWLNWGLTDEEVDSMPPTHASSFGALAPISTGFGSEMGLIEAEGTMVNAGRLLFRDQWNSDLYGPLKESWLEGKKNGTDVLIHKNRMSGAWGVSTALEEYLIKENITTLFTGGCNTDQCVWGTHIDAHNKGYDNILLKDCAGTNSPLGCQAATEYNAGVIGFVATSKDFALGLK